MTPDSYTIQERQLDVGDGHELYVHDWGKGDATNPILFLHGGPGSGCNDGHKRYFDPSRQRVVFFDQRGSGRSTPYGSLEHNTTQDLVDDIVKILDAFEIDRAILVGGSWGSCLALAFTLARPARVQALVLNGIFTARQSEIDWLDQGRFRTFYPDAWQRYLEATPLEHHDNPSAYHFRRILGSDAAAAKESAYAYELLEEAVLRLDDRFTPGSFEDYDPSSSQLEVHYMTNGCFMPDGHIMQNAHTLAMPVYLVQGRYDMVCPPETAYQLAGELPDGELIWTVSGHATERESWNSIRTILLQLTRGTS